MCFNDYKKKFQHSLVPALSDGFPQAVISDSLNPANGRRRNKITAQTNPVHL
jgi:hypothetical protein